MSLHGAEAEQYARDRLAAVGAIPEEWVTLYRDESDGSHWLMSYPQSELHGGGPPKLEQVTEEAASLLQLRARARAS